MTTMTTPFRFRESRPARFDECGICGADTHPVFAQHDNAVHDVWAFETYGMHAVTYPARPFVEAWASGETPLPTRAEFLALSADEN